MNKITVKSISDIALELCRQCDRIKVVADPHDFGNQYLELDGERLGRNFGVYSIMNLGSDGLWATTHIIEEIVLPLKPVDDDLYRWAVDAVMRLPEPVPIRDLQSWGKLKQELLEDGLNGG